MYALTIRVHEEDGHAKVYFEPGDTSALDRLEPGDEVILQARVHEVRRIGGYQRTAGEGTGKRTGFTLDIGDIGLVATIPRRAS